MSRGGSRSGAVRGGWGARASWRRFTAALVVASGWAGVGACSGGQADASSDTNTTGAVQVGAENITIVRTDRLETGPMISGTLAAEREAQIRAEVAGSVLRTFADQGQRVAAGEVLARIDDAAVREAHLSARSGLATAQLNFEIAQKELSRAERLHEAGAIADRDLEGARRASTAARGQLADAEARLALAARQLDATSVRAPFAGVVSVRSVSPGDVVAPGAALYTVVDPASLRLEASVPVEALGAVRLGAAVHFTVTGYGDRPFTGTVTRMNPSADPVTRQVKITASIPASGRLVSGLFAEGRVAADSRLVPSVPSNAVDRRGLVPTVLRIRNGRVEQVEVQLGVLDDVQERVEIVRGVAVGDTLLLGTAQGISPGTAVVVSEPRDQASR